MANRGNDQPPQGNPADFMNYIEQAMTSLVKQMNEKQGGALKDKAFSLPSRVHLPIPAPRSIGKNERKTVKVFDQSLEYTDVGTSPMKPITKIYPEDLGTLMQFPLREEKIRPTPSPRYAEKVEPKYKVNTPGRVYVEHDVSQQFPSNYPVGKTLPSNRYVGPPLSLLPETSQSRSPSRSPGRNIKPYRYTIDSSFLDHWSNKIPLESNVLNFIKSQWASDDWDGLFDPPFWLKPEMFLVALEDIPSNSLKRHKYKKAEMNLKLVRMVDAFGSGVGYEVNNVQIRKVVLSEDLLDLHNNFQNVVSLRLMFLVSRISHQLEAMKIELHKAGTRFLNAANDFNVGMGAVLKEEKIEKKRRRRKENEAIEENDENKESGDKEKEKSDKEKSDKDKGKGKTKETPM